MSEKNLESTWVMIVQTMEESFLNPYDRSHITYGSNQWQAATKTELIHMVHKQIIGGNIREHFFTKQFQKRNNSVNMRVHLRTIYKQSRRPH